MGAGLSWLPPPAQAQVLRWAITAAAGEESDASLRLASAIIPVLDAGVEEDSGLSPESIGLWMATASQLVSCVINLQKARCSLVQTPSCKRCVHACYM